MDAKIKKCCPKCCQYYHLKISSSKTEDGNIPLFLSCGHSMCENCIRTIIKCEEFIECPICGQDKHISGSDQAILGLNKYALYELFPVNINMLGELTLNSIEPISGKTHHDDEYFLNITELININKSSHGECVECHEPTSKMCKQCGIIVCKNCFSKSHKNFIIFKNHALQNIEFQSENTLCVTHKTKSLDYYCTNCAKAICMDCLMVGGEKSCKNHDVTSIQEINEEMLAELAEISPKVDETFRRLTKTAVDIGHTLMRLDDENSSSTFTKLVNQVEQHYSKLNAVIQKQKKEILDAIMNLKFTEIESLHSAKYSVSESIKKAKHTLNTINSIDTNKLKEINISAILKDAKEVLNIPWYLNGEEAGTHLKLKVNEDIFSIVNNYIQLDGKENTTYSLCTTQELNDRHEDVPAAPTTVVYPPEIVRDVRQTHKIKAEKEKENIKPTSFIKKVPQYRSKLGSCSSLNSNTSDSSQKKYTSYDQRPVVSPFPESQHPKQILEGSQELIYISHIVDPHNFYVQRACHQNNVKELLRGFRNAVSMPKPSVSHVAEGKVYLVLNKADNLWQRCRVMTIDRRDLNKPLYRVFCVDFGSTEIVTIDKLRLLPPACIQSPPPFAINCCLANCDPINGAWTSDDSLLIQNIIDNKQAVLHVRRVRSSTAGTVTLECDVSTVAHGLSVAHALAFHGRALMSTTVKYPKMIGIVEKPKLFINNTDFKLNSVEEVYITHIVSPDHFYVRKEHLQSVYEKLCEDLDQEYSLNSNVDSIYLPEKDMSCVVQSGRWSRGVVRELPGRGRVRVLLVDTGELQLLHWTTLRRLHSRFTTLRALATECHLAGVTPLNKKWSPGSVALLHKFEDKLLELHVEDDRNRSSLGVTLYDKSDEDNVLCVNTLMIKYKFAVTFGLFMFNKNSEMDDLVITNKSPLDEPKPVHKEPITTMFKKEEFKTPKAKEDLEAKDKGPLRLEAKILNYQSPSLLYVSLVHQQKIFNELFEKLQKYYTKKKAQGKNVWNVGDRCCTLCCQSQTWRRAAILEVNEGDAKVFYSDFACVETVPLANLRELPQDFASIGDAAIMCHLCGVIPAVGEEWPSLTKEYLSELLDAYKRVFITKLGKFKGKSMPIELWVYHIIQGGALEANTSEWRCLNKKIIEQGLGVPDKSEESTSESSTSNDGDDMLSFLNITGSVRDWLQIEPMPLKPLQIKSDSDSQSCTSTPGETDADKTEEDVPNSKTVFISDWLPPEPLPTTEFTAMPTYTDNDGVVYLHDIAQQDTLHLIRKALDVRFKNPDPKARFVKWSVGEPCIALYFLDNRFYRGRILAVNNEELNCLVHYIDYGNDEICAFENLRKSIALYQIPTQAHKCILNRIQPLGKKWDRTTLDYIHRSVVEKHCFVKVSGDMIGDVIPIELNYDKLSINDHLVDFEMARYSDGSEVVVRKYAPNVDVKKKLEQTIDTDSGPDYIIEDNDTSTSQDSVRISSLEGKDWNELLENDDNNINGKFATYTTFNKTEFECTITVLNETNKLELNILHNEEMGKIYDEMYEELQTESSDMAALDGIFENKACIALFPEDGRWYRASILEYSETSNRIKVKYIDYGNIKVLSLFDVKEITDKYTKLEPGNVTVTLYGVKLNPEIDKHTLSQLYEQTFLDKEPFQAKVIEIHGSVPSVELSQGGKLIYEDLILQNIFISD